MKRLLGWLLRLTAALVVIAIAVGLMLIHRPARHVPSVPEVQDYVYLDQGWGKTRDAALRQAYYYTPQGTSIKNLRYDWLVHLEMPWGKKRLADPAHLRSYGFIVDPERTAANPDQLPVGFAKRFDPELGDDLLDISARPAITGQLRSTARASGPRSASTEDRPATRSPPQARPLRAHAHASLASTYLNPFKSGSLRAQGAGRERLRAWEDRLYDDLGEVLGAFVQQGWKEQSRHLYPVEEGFGRTDALARIGNTVFADELDGANDVVGNAPVSYPYLWNIWKFDWVQYNASVSQPMARNMGESFGVGARLHLLDRFGGPLPVAERFHVGAGREPPPHRDDPAALQPPQWPEDAGSVDRVKAERGRALVRAALPSLPWPVRAAGGREGLPGPLRADADPLWKMTIVPITEVGTITAAANFALPHGRPDTDRPRAGGGQWPWRSPCSAEARRRSPSSTRGSRALAKDDPAAQSSRRPRGTRRAHRARRRRDRGRQDGPGPAAGPGPQLPGTDRARALLRRSRIHARAARACLDGFGSLDLPEIQPAYKARPLAGVWATGPFLHNGAVPTVYQMLSPQDERDTRFFVSPGSFDPVNVGVDKKARGDGFWLDTRLPGNANVGHEFRAGYVPGKTDADDPQYGVIGPPSARTIGGRSSST
jgi:hypothetical protein